MPVNTLHHSWARRQMPFTLIAIGFVLLLAGVGLQMMHDQFPLISMLGLQGTIFGLMAKFGGPFVIAGLFALTVRQTRIPLKPSLSPPILANEFSDGLAHGFGPAALMRQRPRRVVPLAGPHTEVDA